MTLVDLDLPITLKDTEFPDLLPEPDINKSSRTKKNKMKASPPQEIELYQDQESVSLVEEVVSEDEEDLLLDELLDDDESLDGGAAARQHQHPKPTTANSSLNDTLTTDSDRNDGFSSSDDDNDDDPFGNQERQHSVVVVHDLENLAQEEEQPVVVVHHVEEAREHTPPPPSAFLHPIILHEEKGGNVSDYTPSTQSQEDSDEVFQNDDGDDDDDDDCSATTVSLLGHAKDRIAMQHLYDEISELETIIETKNTEIENLSGQLRRAVATKCDLVIAHTELERHHENNLACKESLVEQLKKENCSLKEAKSEIERELLNELVKASDQHRQELDDWERMHRNEMLEKDFEIAKLTEELRQLKHGVISDNGPDSAPKKSKGMRVMFRQ